MLDVYKRMQAEGKIGPNDIDGRPRPFQEYPKWVKDSTGAAHRVRSQREELAVAAITPEGVEITDPVILERNRLAKQVEDLRKELAALASATPPKAAESPRAPTFAPQLPASASVSGEPTKELVK